MKVYSVHDEENNYGVFLKLRDAEFFSDTLQGCIEIEEFDVIEYSDMDEGE